MIRNSISPLQVIRSYCRIQVSTLLIVIFPFWSCQVKGVTLTWDSDGTLGAPIGGAGTWNTSLPLWNNAGVMQAWSNVGGDTALFGGAPGIVTLGAPITAGGLIFDGDGYTLAGGGSALTLGGAVPAITVTNPATQATIQSDVALAGNAVFGGAGNLTLNTGVISGSGFGFNKLGTGVLTLGGSNTFSGPVTLHSGTTSISAANNLGDGSATNTLTLAGGTLQAAASFNLGTNRGPIIGQGDGVIEVTGANNLTVDGALSVAAGLTGGVILNKTGSGTLTLTGTNNTAAIATTVNGGTLSIASNSNLGSGRVTLNGGTLQATGSGTITNGIALGRSGGSVDVSTGVTFQSAGAGIMGPGSLTKTGAGTLQINIASTYAGSTTISQGTLNGGVASFLPPRTQLSIASGATLNLNAFATGMASLSGSGTVTNTGAAAALTLGNQLGSVDSTFSGIFSATSATNLTVTKNGGGTLTLTNSGTAGNATGAWTLTAGTVKLDYANAGSQVGNIINGSIPPTFAGGTLNVTGRNGATVAQALGNVTLNAGGSAITMVPNGGTSTMLTLGTVPVSGGTATTAGGALLITAPTGTSVRVTTTDVSNGTYGGRIVFSDGSDYNWASNGGGASPRTFTSYSGYTGLVASGGSAAVNYSQADTLAGGITATQSVNSLKITTTTTGQSLDLNGNALTLANGGLLFTGAHDFEILTTGGLGTLKSGTATNSDFIVQQYGTGVLTISAPIVANTGTSTLTKAGTGTLILAGANTYTGGTIIDAGTLSISSNNALGATATSAITISDGATFKTTADVNTLTHTFSLTGGNATMDVANATTLTIGGVISGAGGLTLTNTGTLVLAAANTYTGPTFVGAGATLKGGATTFINATAGGTLTVAAGGTVDMNNFTLNVGAIEGSGTITNSGGTAVTLSFGSTTNTSSTNQDSTFSGTLSGALNLGKNGAGTLTLTTPATYTGTSAVTNGGVVFGVNNALPVGALTLGNNAGPTMAFVDMNGFNWTSGAITFYGTSGGLTSQASLNVGSGILTLGGTVTLSTNTTAANSALPAFITGGTIDLPASRSFAIADSPNATVDLTVTSVISSVGGAFGITKTGAGTLLLTGANTYSGTTTVNGAGGVLLVGGAGTLGAGAGALTMTAGTLDLNGTNQTVGALTGAAAGAIRNGAAGTLSTLNIGTGSTGAGIYAGTISDGGGTLALVKNGAGNTALTGANTYTGGTQVNEGVLTYGTTASQPASGITQVAATAALGLGVGGAGFFSSTDVDALFTNTLPNVNMAAGASVGIDTAAGDFTYSTNQSAARGLVKLGANVLTLTGANTYSGVTTISGGVLNVGSVENAGVSGPLGQSAASNPGSIVFNGGSLQFSAVNTNDYSGRFSTAANQALSIDTNGQNVTFATALTSVGGSLTKQGAGALTLSSTGNSYSGNTIVSGGTLNITGAYTGGSTSIINYGAAAANTIVNVSGNMTLASLLGGSIAGASAVYNQTAGSVTVTAANDSNTNNTVAQAGYGYFNLTGGSFNMAGNRFNITSGAATGVAYVGGTGVLNHAGGTYFMVAYNGTGSTGSLTVGPGGSVIHDGATQALVVVWTSNNLTGIVNVAGGTLSTTTQPVRFGGAGSNTGTTGFVNVASGTLSTGTAMTTSFAGGSGNNAYLNFAGGTLKTTANVTALIPPSTANITVTSTLFGPINNTLATGDNSQNFAGGLIFDTNGFNSSLTNVLKGATGVGVTQPDLTVNGGTGYIGAPAVVFSTTGVSAGGTPASGYALISNGQVTGIVITNPGTYDAGTIPTITLTGGGGTGASVVSAALNTANVSGGLTKTGAGTLTLSGVNTYSGDTIVNGGILSVGATTLPNTANLLVGSTGSGSFNLYQDGVGTAWAMPANANLTLGSATTSGAAGFQLGTASDSIILSGTGGLTVNAGGGFIDATALSGFGVGSYDVITGASGISGFSNLKLGSLPGGYSYSLSNGGNKITLNVAAIAAGDFYWTGDASSSWATIAGGNTNWSTTSNGLTDPGYTPGTANAVTFSASNASAAPIVTTLDNSFSIPSLKFINSGTGAVTIAPGSGGSLAIGSGGIEVQAGAPSSTTISAPLGLGAAQTWTLTGAGKTLDASGVISGGVANSTQASPGSNTSLTITGGGTVSITNTGNTFTGDIVVDGSTLIVSNDRSWGGSTVASSTSHTITLQNGAKLSVPTGTINPGALTTTNYNLVRIGTGGATIDTGSTAILQLDDAGQFFGNGNLTKTGDGVLLLSNAFTGYTGTLVTVLGGELRLQNSQALGATGAQAAISLAGGTILRLRNSTSGMNIGSSVTVNGDVTVIADKTSAGTAVTHTAGPLTIGTNTMTVAHGANFNADNTGSVTFGALTLTGSPTFISNNINGAGVGTLTLGAVDLGSNQITFDGSANASLSGIVSGAGSLVRKGSGQLTLGAVANTFNGGILIKSGVVLGGANALTFGASTNIITLGDTSGSADASLRASSSQTYPQPINVAGGNTGVASIIAGNSTGNVIFSGPITLNNHDVLLGKTGTTGSSQFTGGITGTGDITINNTATTGTITLATGVINNVGTITNTSTATGTTTISTQIGSNVTDVTQNSTSSILSLSGTNPNFAGTVTVTSGTLQMGGASALNAANAVSIAGGATFNLNGNNETIAGLTGAGTANNSGSARVLTLGGTGNYVFDGIITGTTPANMALTVALKGGTQTLTGQSLYTGATTVNRGTLVLDFNASSLVSNILSSSSPLVMGGGTLSVIGDALASSQTFASSSLTASTYNVVSATAGAGGLVLDLGTLTRNLNSGLNVNLSGNPDVRIAGVAVANGLAVASNGAAFMTINRTDWGTMAGNNPTVFTGYVNDTFTGSADNVNVTASASWTGGAVNTLRFNTGSPTLTLAGENLLNAGGILVGSGAGAVTIAGSGTLAGGAVNGTVAAPVAGELGVFQNSASDMTISVPIVNHSAGISHVTATPSGTAFNKYGTGTLVLSSSQNAYTGGTSVQNGILRLGTAKALPDGAATPGAVTVAAPATLDLNGFSETINGLAGSGTVDNSTTTAATLYVGNTNASTTFSGVLQNSGMAVGLALTKIGTGTLTLNGANTYTGATTISAGGVTLNFTLAGAPLSNIISSASALELGSSTLTVTGSTVANSQTFNGTLLSGGSRVTLSGTTPALTVNLGAITRTAVSGASGSLNVTLVTPGVVTTTNTNDATGILGSWAVVNSADFATVSSGSIVAYTGYTAIGGATGAGNTTQNALFNASNSVDTATVDYNTVKMATTINFAATGNILRLGSTGAILMPTGLAAASIGATAGSGIITAGGVANTAGELNLINWSANTLTVNSAINNNGTGVVTLVKSGTGALTLASTNGYTGGTIINGGTLTASTAAQLSSGPITLNGGNLTLADFSLANALTLGPAGGTLTFSGSLTTNRTYGVVGNLGTVGSGTRVLTFAGGTDVRLATLQSNVIDGAGGATSLVVGLGGDLRVVRLSGVNTYTGTTTLTRGVLDFTAVSAIPGGITNAATVGNIMFGATTTARAILQSSVATPTAFTRTVGYGDGQVHWEGNGGFSNNIANTSWVVNLGGSGEQVVWGVGGFVPNNSILQFGVGSVSNSVTNLGAVEFQNAIDLGGVLRTIDSASGNDKQGNTPYDVILSGNLTSSAGGGINKTGSGLMILSGVNNTSLTTSVTVTAGTLIFANASAIPGTGANLTLSTTATGDSAIGLIGDTDPMTTLGGRIANPATATSAFALGADSSVDFDFTNYPNMRLAAYAFPVPAKAINYTGTITPGNSTYRFGGVAFAGDPINGLAFALVLPKTNALTGGNALSMSFGNLTLLGTNNFTGGTTLDGSTVGNSLISIGSNAALGTEVITLAGNQTKSFGSVNGDRYLSNNIAWAGSGTSWVAGGDAANDGVTSTTNGGGMTYLGTISITNSATTPTIISRTGHQVLLLGDIAKISGASTTLIYSASTVGLLSSLATPANGGTAKTYNLNTTINSTTTLVIDSDSSFGASTGVLSLGNSGSTGNTATLRLQPGTGAVTLNASRSVTIASDRNVEMRIGTGGSLTIAGVVGAQGTNTAVRNIIKTDQGTLVFTNKNGFTGAATATLSPGLAIRGGSILLDSSSGSFTAAADRFFPDATSPLPIAFGVATGTFGGGGTLEIIQASGNAFALTQGFGIPTFNTGANTIKLTNNSTTQALTLNFASTFTRTNLLGGTLNFATSSAGGANTIGSTVANANGIIGAYATFNGLDWATQSGGSIIALPSGSYTTNLPGTGASATANYVDSQVAVTVSAAESINSLKLTPTASGQTITINTGIVLRNTSNTSTTPLGIIYDNTNGSSTITSTGSGTGTGQLNTTGAELIIHTYGSGDSTTKKLTLAGVVKGSASVITKTGPGTLVLAGTNTYTGSLIINAGTVEYANGSASGQNLGSPTAGAGNILLNGGTLRQTATNNLIYGITVNGYSKLDVPTGVTLNQTAQGITGKVGVTGILQKTGLGTLTFSGGTDNAALSLDVAGGIVNLGKSSTSAIHSVGVAAGATAAASMGASLLIGSGSTVNITGSGGDQIHDQSSVVVRTGGVFNLGGGAATSEAFDGLAGGGSVTNTGLAGTFTLTLGAGNSVNISSYMLAAAEAGVAASGLNNFSGVISDGGAGKVVALTKTGGGIQILSGHNTYSGATSIIAGTLQLGIANALPGGVGKGDVNIIGNGYGAGTINGGTSIGTADKVLAAGTLDMGGFDQEINGLNSSTGGYVVNNPTLIYNGSAWVSAASSNTLTVGNADASGNFNGIIMDGYTVAPGAVTAQAYIGMLSLIKVGTGTQTLGGANTYSGSTTIKGGAVASSANNVIPSTSAVTLAATLGGGSTTLNLNGFSNSIASLTLGGAANATSTVQTGVGILTLLGNVTYDATNNAGAAVIQGKLALGGSTRTFSIADSTGTASELTVNAVISDGAATAGIIKTGGGTMILTGANSYTGTTSLTGGTLQVNNVSGSGTGMGSVITSLGTTLAGTGILSPTGSNGISIGGLLAPGAPGTNNGVGTLSLATVDGNVVMGGTSTGGFQLLTNGTHGYTITYDSNGFIDTISGMYADGGNDRLLFNSSGTGQIDFSAMATGSLGVTFAAGYTPALHDLFDLIDWTSIQGLSASQLALPSLASYDPTWGWDTSKFLSNGVIGIMVIPEPGRVLLLLLGLGSLALRRRRY